MDPLFSEVHHTLIIEPFYGGSHRQLIDLLMNKSPSCVKYTLPATKWHWKARTSALHFAQVVPRSEHYRVLFASSVLNLAELVAMRADLFALHKVLYFHENQLVYPVRKQQDRDFQYGYNQIISCLIADTILFNSTYNMESFLSGIDSFLGLIPVPGYKSRDMHKPIRPKCRVLHFPLQLPKLESISPGEPGGCRPYAPNQPITSRPAGSEDWADGIANADEDRARTERSSDKSQSESSSVDEDSDSLSSPSRRKFGNFRFARRVSKENVSSNKKRHNKEDSALRSRERAESHDSIHSLDSSQSCDSAQSHDSAQSQEGVPLHAGDKRAMWQSSSQKPLHILWAHRWEHDKNPELFFDTLLKLDEMGLEFRVSILGEQFTEVPDIFAEAKAKLQNRILNWGYQSSKEDYYRVLFSADVAVSTADHEFFGVAMLEAVYLRCYPLCPNCLVYPEMFPKEYLFNTAQQLFKRLREFCRHPHLVRKHTLQVDVGQYSWEVLKDEYLDILSSASPRIRMKMFPRSSFEIVDKRATRQHSAGSQSVNHGAVAKATSVESKTREQQDRVLGDKLAAQQSKALAQLSAQQNQSTDQHATAGYQSNSGHSNAELATQPSKATSQSTVRQSTSVCQPAAPNSKATSWSASQQSKAITQKYKHLLSPARSGAKH